MLMKVLFGVFIGDGELKRIRREGKQLFIHDGIGVVRERPEGIAPNGFAKRRLSGLGDQFEGTGSEKLETLCQIRERRGFGNRTDLRLAQADELHLVAAEVFIVETFEPAAQFFVVDFVGRGGSKF